MNPFVAAVVTSPAAPFIALSAAVAGIAAIRGNLAAKITGPAWWGLFAFVTTHLVTELWRLSDDIDVQVGLFSLGLFYVAGLYALLLRDHRLPALLLAVGLLFLALPTMPPAQIRLVWFALAVLRVAYCALIFVEIPRSDLFARMIWAVLIVVHGVTVIEQFDCQLLPGLGRPFEDGAACSYVWKDWLGVEFSYWLYAVYSLPLAWIVWHRYKIPE